MHRLRQQSVRGTDSRNKHPPQVFFRFLFLLFTLFSHQSGARFLLSHIFCFGSPRRVTDPRAVPPEGLNVSESHGCSRAINPPSQEQPTRRGSKGRRRARSPPFFTRCLFRASRASLPALFSFLSPPNLTGCYSSPSVQI